ncbi:hypothetical protein SNE40_022980 [Patella caerulea]|uniref:C2H2-type domain-containing protein n=1 Tax=Patella caerulea TaxID=87958 RepID=A0AAN8J008_PATCE
MAEDSKPRNLFDDFCSAVTEESLEKESTATALFADASMSSGCTDIKHQSEKLKFVTDSIKKNTKNVSLNILHSPTIDEIGSLPKSNNEIPIKSSTNFVEGEQESERKEGGDFMEFSDTLVGFDNDYIKSSKKHAEKNASIVLDINMEVNNQNIQEKDPSFEENYYLELSDVSDHEDELSTKSFPVMEDSKCDGDFDLSGSFLVIDEYKCEENSEEELNKIEAVKCKSHKSLETNDSNIPSETVSNYEQPCSSSAAKTNSNDIQLETVHSNEQLSSKSTADDEQIEKNKSNIQSASSDCDTNDQSVANYCDTNKQLCEKDKQMKIGYIVKQFESNDDRMKRLERIDTDRVLEEIERQLEKIDSKDKLESDDEKRLETIDSGKPLKTSDNDKPLGPNHSVTQLTTIGKDKQLNTSVSNKPLHVQTNDHKKLLQTNAVDQPLVTHASDSDWQPETKDNDKQLTTNISDKLLETRDIDKQLNIKDIDTPLETKDIDKLFKTKDMDKPLEAGDSDKQLTVSCEDKQLTMCNENNKLDANVAVNVGDKLETNFRNEHTTSNEFKDLATSETVKSLVETNDCDKLLNTCASGGDKRFDDEVMTKKEVKTIRNDLSKKSVTEYDHEQIETNEIEEQLKPYVHVAEEQMTTCGINKKIVTSDGDKQIEAELMVEQITSIRYDNQVETKNSNKLIKSDHSDKQIETHISDKQIDTHIISDKQIETHISDKPLETHISDKPLDTNDGKNPLETNDGENPFKRTNSENQFETDYCDDQIKTYIDKPLETNNSDSNCKLSDETVCKDKIFKISDSYKNQQSQMSHTDNNTYLESSCGEKLLGIHIDTDIDSNKHSEISHSESNKHLETICGEKLSKINDEHSVFGKQGETIDGSKQFVTRDCETTLISCTKKNDQDGHLECQLPKENNDVGDITMLSYATKDHISEGKTIEGPQDSSSENPLIGNIVNDPVEYCFKSSNTSSYSSKALENAKDKRHLVVINNEIIKTSDVTNEVPQDDHFKAEKEDPNTVVHNSELSENLQSTQEDSFNNYESMKTSKITELSGDHPDAKLADLNTLVDNYKASVNLEQNTLLGCPVISSEATKTNQVTDVPEDDISYTELDDLQEDHSSDNHSIGDSENMDEDSETPFSLDFSVEQTGDDQYKCSCGFIEKENSFIKHLIIHHLINKPYRCCYCKISLERKKDIKKHHKETHQSNPERWNLIGVKKAKRICSITSQNRNYVHKPSKISDKIFSSKLLHLKSSDEIDSKSSSDGESFLNIRKTSQDVVITNERQSYDTVSKADRTEHQRSFDHSCVKPASSKKGNRHSFNHGSTHSPVETFQNCESERPKSKSYPPLYDQTLNVHSGPPDSVGSILYVPVSNALYLLPFNSTSVTSTSVVSKIGPKTSEAIMLTRDHPSAAVASRGYESTSIKSNSHICTTTGGVSNALYLVPFNTAPVSSISVANVTGPKAFEAITQTRDHPSAVVASRGYESASSHSKTSTCNSQICTTTGGISNSLYMVPFNTTSVTSTLAANVTGPKASEAIPQTTDHPSVAVASRGYESVSSHLRNFACNSHICTTTNGVAVAESINTNAAASINSSCIISNSGGTIAEYDALESIHAPTVAIDNCGVSVSSISKDTGGYNQLLTHNKSLGNSVSIEKPVSCSPNAKRMHEIVEKVTGVFRFLDGHYICFSCHTKWPEKTKFWWHVWFHLHQGKKLCGKCSGDEESLTCSKVKQVMTIIDSVSVDKNNPARIPLQTTKIQEQNQGNTEFCDASPNTTFSTNVNQDEHILPVVDFIREDSHQTMTNENQQSLFTSQTTSTTVFNQGNQVNQEMCSNETQALASKNHQELPVQQSRHTKRLDKEICSNEILILEKTAPSGISSKQPNPPTTFNQDKNHTGHQRLLLMSSTLSHQKVFSNENKSTSTQNHQTSPTQRSMGSSEMRIEVNLSEHQVKNSTSSLQELLPQRYGSSTHLLNLLSNGNSHSQMTPQTKQQSTNLNSLIQTVSPIIDHPFCLASQVKSNTSPQEALSQQSGSSTLLINLLRSNGNENYHSQFTQKTKQQSMLLNGLIQPGSSKIDNVSSPHRPLHQQSGSSVHLINLLSTNQPVTSNGNSHPVSPVTINQETCSMGMLPLSNSIENRISIQQPPSQQGLETGAKDTPVNIVRKFIANNGVMHTPKNTTSEEFAQKKLEIVREIKALLQYIREENNKLVIPDPPKIKATNYLMSLDLLSKIMVSAAESSKVSQYSCSDEGGDATPKQVDVPISSEFVTEPVSFVPEKKPILFKCKPDTKPPQLYACSCCRFSTLLHMKFKKHLLSEHHQLLITCVHCGFKSKTVDVFIKHLQRHTQPINPRIPAFKCLSGRCFYQCNTLIDFIKHLKTHEDYDHKCHHCDQQFATLEELHQHYKSSFFTTVSCPTCRARSTDKQSILDHISRHHPNKGRMVSVLKQLICKARIENNFAKMAHIQNEWDNPDSDNDDIQILEAIDCETSVSCETHKDLAHRNEEMNADLESDKSKPALESDQIYNQTLENDKNDQHGAESDKHILCNAHNGKNAYYSSKNLETNKYSNINSSENSQKIEPIAPCSESKDSVDHGEPVVCRNKRNSLSYDFGFKCDLCSFVADRSTSLDNHIAKHNQCQISTHPKDFCCTFCPATFNELSDLENHLQHHDDKISFTLYGCNVDEYKSNVYSNIRSHLTEHHQVSCDNKDMYSEGTVVLESKVIQCPDCAYNCVNKIVLTEHLKKHNRSRTQKSKSRLSADTDIVDSDTNVHIVHPESKVNSQKGKDSDLFDSIVSELYKHENCLYICKVCEKSLKFKKALHVHICYHIDIPFKCMKCAFSAKQLAQVISHVKDEHSAEDVSISFSDKMKDRVKSLLAVTKTAEKNTNHVDPKPILKPRRKFFVRGSSGIISITVNKKSEGEYPEQLDGKDNVSPDRSVNPERAEGCPMDLLDTSNTEGTKSSDSKYQLDADYISTDEGLSKNKASKPHNSNNVKTDMPLKSSVDDFSLLMTSIDETTQKRSRNKSGKKNETNSESSGRIKFDTGLTDNGDNQKTVPTVKLLSEMKDNNNIQLSNSPRRTLISSSKSSKSTFKKKRCNSPLKLKMNFKLKKKSLLPSNYKCPKCDFVTSFDEEVMKTHLKQHKLESVYECNKCSVKFHSFQQIEIHSNVLHHGDVDYRPVPVLNIPLRGFFKKVKSTLANKPQTGVNYNSKREIKHIPNVDDEGKADKQSCDIKDQRPQSSFKTVLKTGGRSVSIESSNTMKRKSLGDGEGTAAIHFCEASTSYEMQRNKPQDGGSKALISRPKDKPGSNEPPNNTALKRKSNESEDKAAKRKSLGDGEGTEVIPFCESSTSNEMKRNKPQDDGSKIVISRPKDKPSGNEPPNKTALKRKSNGSEDKAAKRLCTREGNDETGSGVTKDEELKGAPDFTTTERSVKKKSHKGDLRPPLFVVKKAVKTKTTASLDQSNMQIGCRYCHKLFTSIFNIAKHVSIRHVRKKVLWTDTLSGCVFNETGTHMKSSENCDHQNKFLCGHCEFRGNTRGSVKHHLKEVHCGNVKNWIKLSGGKEEPPSTRSSESDAGKKKIDQL